MQAQTQPPKTDTAVLMAVLMPHAPVLIPSVGGHRIQDVAATLAALRQLSSRIIARHPEALVVISPHSPRRPGGFGFWATRRIAGTLERFGCPEVSVDLPGDPALAEAIRKAAAADGLETWPVAHGELDHGALVPLWFLVEAGWSGPTVVAGLSGEGASRLRQLGAAIARGAADAGRRIVVVASGDMSHRLQPGAPGGFDPRAGDFDRGFMERLGAGDLEGAVAPEPELLEHAGEDVVDSTTVACSASCWNHQGHRVLSYQGPFGVGYGVAILTDSAESPEVVSTGAPAADAGLGTLPMVARRSLTEALGGARGSDQAASRPEALRQRRAVFVTLRSAAGELRGCVGTILPKFRDVVEETWQMAREAAFRDSRFAPVRAHELAGLRIEVSVLHTPEAVSGLEALDPSRYGVVVQAEDGRRGLLLPGLKGIDTAARQVAVAREKAGIDPDEPVTLERFEVEHFVEGV